ncbi:hypothetical protein [Fibrobacter sp. UWR2]|uniref:hypothetical protein n=1 Tax=Fibrobacter sp. UWR2 TaxID=1964352 RepID=UPI001183012A|nr:hypothetical protein [Fibrobacter sp. UWR2]
MVACSDDNVAGGTIDPSTIAKISSSSDAVKVVSSSSMSETENGVVAPETESSSSGESNHSIKPDVSSSSGRAVMESSSSLEDGQSDVLPIDESSSSEKDRSNVILRPRNFSLECSVDVVKVDTDEPAVSSDVLAPYASKSVAADSVNILISDYFNIPCGESEAEAFMEWANTPGYTSLGLNYDTLYVKVIRSKGMSYDCSCVARVQFTLDAEYSDIKYTVLEQRNAIQLKELE